MPAVALNDPSVVAAAEARLGRKLTRGEQAIDLRAVDVALETGKERLRALIELEKRRVITLLVRQGIVSGLAVTPEMLAALRALYAEGQRQARAEIRRLDVEVRPVIAPLAILTDAEALALAEYVRDFDGLSVPAALRRVRDLLSTLLVGISRRVQREAVTADLSTVAASAAIRALDRRVPGALDAASRLVSPALLSGVGDVFEAHADLFDAWTYTAIMDAATCDVCAELDGSSYPSWDDLMGVLPDGGPNPDCYGGSRCRCRGVPEPAALPLAA